MYTRDPHQLMLEDRNVVLCVTGSIAAVRTVELAHELRRQGAAVRAVTTPGATGIVHPWALEFATEQPVVTEITGRVEHVELCGRDGWADVVLVAPATANTVGKIAAAIDDTPVTTTVTTALGADCPIVVAPAMHEPMYDHPGVLDALDRLEGWGVRFADPRLEEGKAKIAATPTIVTELARATTPNPLSGRHVVVTAGATTEPIDPIRTFSNRASGRTGRAVARACYIRGADVTLVHDGPEKPWAAVERVETAAEMLAAVQAHADRADAVVSAAAIADYTTDPAEEKLRSGADQLVLELAPTPKLVERIGADYDLPVVGFKAETDSSDSALVDRARRLQDRAGLLFVVGNDASVMGGVDTRAVIVDGPTTAWIEGSKQRLGARVADRLGAAL